MSEDKIESADYWRGRYEGLREGLEMGRSERTLVYPTTYPAHPTYTPWWQGPFTYGTTTAPSITTNPSPTIT